MKFLAVLKSLAATAALLALALAALAFACNFGTPRYLVDRLTDDLSVVIEHEGLATRAAAFKAIADSRADVLAKVDRLTDVAQKEIRDTRDVASAHIVGLAGVLDRRVESVQTDLNAHGLIVERLAARELGRAVDSWDQISTEATATLAESRRTVHDLHPQLLGLVAASKVAAGELATGGREFQRVIIPSIERIAENSDRTTAASAQIAQNFAVASRPLPKWMRVVLAVAPPVAATGASAVGAGAVLGLFK